YLLEHDPDSPLVDILTARIDAWENNAVEFEEFNTRIEAGKNGVSLLRVLMQQRGFSQSDFENEIGNKSLVSRILSGERSLTLDHMRALANRFQGKRIKWLILPLHESETDRHLIGLSG
ncbi:helix-turn-helix domain-containing protein, partial [Klebsiella pneumoniae]